MHRQPLAVFLMGPTATGKTAAAIALSEKLPCDLISVDSAMVYRGMDIGTAKPSQEMLAAIPHRLINVCDLSENYSAARFRNDALAEMQDISNKGRIPLLVGGTLLYFRALEKGLSPLPAADPQVRAVIEREATLMGWAALHAQLEKIDPISAERIHPNDPQRIQRALEVFRSTGKTLTHHHSLKLAEPIPYRVIKFGVIPNNRQALSNRIADRFQHMLHKGLIQEVERVLSKIDKKKVPSALRMVGYKQVSAYLEGLLTYEQMCDQAITATRQLAKRQTTWLRSEDNMVSYTELTKEVNQQMRDYIERIALNTS